MNYSEANRASKQLDQSIIKLKQSIEMGRQRRKERGNKIFVRLLKPFFPSYKLLTKSEISNSDFSDIKDELKFEVLYDQIQELIDSLTHQRLETGVQCFNTFGLYDTIIKKITRKDMIWFHSLQVCNLAVEAFIYNECLWLVNRVAEYHKSGNQDEWLFVKSLGFLALGVVLSRFLGAMCTRLEFNLSMKIRQALTIIIYNKIVVSEQHFLQSCDSSTIHKLFYWYMEDYCSYYSSRVQILKLCMWWVVYLQWFVRISSSQLVSGIPYWMAGVFCTLFMMFVYSMKIRAFKQFRNCLLREREILQEVLNDFKTLAFSPFLSKYKKSLDNLAKQKEGFLSKIYLHENWFNRCLNYFPYLAPLVFFVSALIKCRASLHLDVAIDGSHEVSKYMELKVVIANLAFAPFLVSFLRSSVIQFAAKMRHESAKQYYDTFLIDDYMIERSLFKSPELGIGEIIIENCDVYEKEHHEVRAKLDVLYDNKASKLIEEKLKSKNKSKVLPIVKPRLNTVVLRSKGATYFKSTIQTKETVAKSTGGLIRLVCRNLSFRMAPGEQICIYFNRNHMTAIKGLVNLILGENIIRTGAIKFNGNLSLFSKERMPFIVGRSIRDNILFGEDFNPNRYEETLNVLGVKFDRYSGRDLYQVREKASNIQSDDKLMILLARFLYREANIYIVEDLLVDINYSVHEHLLERIFKIFLKGKTLIYVSRQKQFLLWASQVIKFHGNYRYTVLNQEQVKKKLELTTKWGQSNAKYLTSKGKIKNSIFIDSLSFEEELAIHKKIEKEKEEIERSKEKYPDKLDRIVYGIYLTEKKRHEGQNIKGFSKIDEDRFRGFWSGVFWATGGISKKRFYFLFMLRVIINILLMVFEYQLVFRTFHGDSLVISLRPHDMCLAIALFCSAFACSVISDSIRSAIKLKTFSQENKKLMNKILTSQHSLIGSHYFHDILSKSTDDCQAIFLDLYQNFGLASDSLIVIILSCIALSYIYSVLLPVLLFGAYFSLMYYFIKRLIPSYIKVVSITYYNNYRKDNFNYQLLSLVFGYRVASALHKLNQKFLRLSDNLVRNEKLILVDYKMLFMRLNSIMQIFVVSCFMAMFILFIKRPWWNFFHMKNIGFVWSIPLLYRLISRVDSFLFGMLHHYRQMVDRYKLEQFLEPDCGKLARKHSLFESVKTWEPEPEAELWKKFSTKPDFTRPVRFKNVSLTLGYQPILKKISFRVKPRQRVGILGVDGGGRSSIFDLILGIKQKDCKQNSSIKIFGVPVERLDSRLRKEIRVVLREPLINEGTIRSNIDPEQKFSDPQLIEILTALNVTKVLSRELINNHLKLKRTILMPSRNQPQPAKSAAFKLSNRASGFALFRKTAESIESLRLKFKFTSMNLMEAQKPIADILLSNREGEPKPPEPTPKEEARSPASKKQGILLPRSDFMTKKSTGQSLPKHFSTGDWQLSKEHDPMKLEQAIETDFGGEIINKKESPPEKRIGQPDRPVDTGEKTGDNKGLQPTPRKVARSVTHRGEEKLGQNDNDSSSSSDEDGDTSIVGNQNAEDSALSGEKGDNLGENGLAPNLAEFLNIKVSFAGQNIEKSLRKVVSFARTILEQPKLLMIYEEALSWGNDVSSNLDILRARSPDTTVLAITQSNRGVLSYDQVLLLDGGMIIDQGDPVELIRREQSHFYNYLKETDREMFAQIRAQVDERQNKGDLRTKQHAEDRNPDSDEDSPKGR